MFEGYDVDADGHVSEKDLAHMFEEAGVSKECSNSAMTEQLKTLLEMHDHDGDGKVSHHETKS